MRFRLILAILVNLIFASSSGFAQNPDTLRIEPASAQVCDIVEVPVYLANYSDSALGILINVGFEPDKLMPIDLRLTGRGEMFAESSWQWAYRLPEDETGIIRFLAYDFYTEYPLPIGAGPIFIIRFAITGYALGSTPIWFVNNDVDYCLFSNLQGLNFLPELINGEVIITSGDFDEICPCLYIPGDVNGDSSVIGSDVTFLVNYFRGSGDSPPNACWYDSSGDRLYSAADVNGDCQAIGSDVTFMVNYFRGDQPEILYCPQTPPIVLFDHTEIRGECLGELTADVDSGYMEIEVVDNDLHIHHIDAYYQCCLEYYVGYEFDGNVITATEFDIGELCDCYCPFNLESILYDLNPGTYTIRLIGISGGLIGEDTFTIGGR